MPAIRKLNADEISAIEKSHKPGNKGVRAATAATYDALVAEFSAGEFGDFELSEGENKLTVRKHIAKAAERKGLAVEFPRGKKSVVRAAFVEKPVAATPAE